MPLNCRNSRLEGVLWRQGQLVAGVDEVGRGPLAGPVVAAAVVLPPWADLPGVTDSKRLTAKRREALSELIEAQALAIGIGEASVERIGAVNIRVAALEAMADALRAAASELQPDLMGYVFVDGNAEVPAVPWPQRAIVKGDSRSLSIAAASIVAKVYRDRLALTWEQTYPEYGFARHKGYASKEHIAAIQRHGPCPLHRPLFLRKILVSSGGVAVR